ncbi:Caffeoylshikimate esterase [Actinidia chinensis var. chinensis]|uniref:Caffeoylshikimate esterase n=1 Tax=Actinidia chinensis var. chinensis TaxID=1590841 RepID=A0A2R6QAM9_ACTCC|nr:Caffeoylshikimate esterase [Actinidia chinensis var. chinensis]
MAHPIHEANEKSPFGDLTREEFYKKHQIVHQESFLLNQQNMKIFTQSWKPSSGPGLRGLVAMVHGYTDESSWLIQLTAVGMVKAGFYVCALDLQGHGYSDGSRGHIPNIEPVVEDCIQFFDSARASQPKLPAFLFGESLGGAIAILICLKQENKWNGLILNAAMCGVSKKFKPVWPLEELLPVAAFVAPTWKVAVTEDPARRSYKEEWKRKLVMKSPNRLANGKVTAATALEFLRVCEHIKRNSHGLELPLLVVHGGEDKICDPNSARWVHDSAASKDKTLKIFKGMWHQFIGEPNENVELVFGAILSWLGERASSVITTHSNE